MHSKAKRKEKKMKGYLKRTAIITGTILFTLLALASRGTYHAFIYITLAVICSTAILKEVMPE